MCKSMVTFTLTPAALDAIREEMLVMIPVGAVREIHIAPENGTTCLVTLDAGWGAYSFHVNRNGKTWQAGLGIGASLAE